VLPMLREVFPQVDQSVLRLGHLAQDAATLIQYQLEAVLPLVLPEPNRLLLQPFSQLAPALKRRVLRHFVTPFEPDLSQEHTDYLLNGLLADRETDGGLLSLGNDPLTGRKRFLAIYRDEVRVRVQPESVSVQLAVTLSQPFAISALPMGCTLSVTPVADKATYWVDNLWRTLADLTPFTHLPVLWRTRLPGDRIQPEGHSSPIKLKDYLIDAGIHRFDRNTLMLLACGRNVLWVPGLVRSQQLIPTIQPGGVTTHYMCASAKQPLFAYTPTDHADPVLAIPI
jgi:tRNA(Ile)-lysidine synthetase-like protein